MKQDQKQHKEELKRYSSTEAVMRLEKEVARKLRAPVFVRRCFAEDFNAAM